jgi:hypothetical protein
MNIRRLVTTSKRRLQLLALVVPLESAGGRLFVGFQEAQLR